MVFHVIMIFHVGVQIFLSYQKNEIDDKDCLCKRLFID